MFKLVLLRHGQSKWNKSNRFTGWTDVDLTKEGIEEAKDAAKYLKKEEFTFDFAYTSFLKRAIRTLWIVLDKMDLMWIPVIRSWRLNEKHYGALQGLYKHKTAKKYGEEQVHKWRRVYDVRPPVLEKSDKRHPVHEEKYKGINEKYLPSTECLKDVVKRFTPYWKKEIAPTIKSKKKVLISAHGNSIRALVKFLDKVPDEEISQLNIPTGIPLIYELDKKLKPIKHYYIGDKKKIQKAIESVKKQGKAR